jgi:hypothetical protein
MAKLLTVFQKRMVLPLPRLCLNISHLHLTAYTLLLVNTLNLLLPSTIRKDMKLELISLKSADIVVELALKKGLIADRSKIDPRTVCRKLRPKSKNHYLHLLVVTGKEAYCSYLGLLYKYAEHKEKEKGEKKPRGETIPLYTQPRSSDGREKEDYRAVRASL